MTWGVGWTMVATGAVTGGAVEQGRGWIRGERDGIPGRWWIVAGLAALLVLADVVTSLTLTDEPGSARIVAWDARVYWDALAHEDPYVGARLGVLGSYLYSPAFLVLLAPVQVVGWHAFLFALTAAGAASGTWLLERSDPRIRRWWPLLAGAAAIDLWAGNIHLLLAASIVVGLRSSPGWTFAALTKVTPAIGLLWPVLRRDWPGAAASVAALALVVTITLPADAGLWPAWGQMLTSQDQPFAFVILPAPLPVRLVLAAGILAWAARNDRRWAVPLACLLALPAIWPISLALLLGSAALWRPAEVPVRAGPLRARARRPRAARGRGGTVAT